MSEVAAKFITPEQRGKIAEAAIELESTPESITPFLELVSDILKQSNVHHTFIMGIDKHISPDVHEIDIGILTGAHESAFAEMASELLTRVHTKSIKTYEAIIDLHEKKVRATSKTKKPTKNIPVEGT